MRLVGIREIIDSPRNSICNRRGFFFAYVRSSTWFFRICSFSAAWFVRVLSETTWTSLLPTMKSLLRYSSGRPAQDLLTWTFVLWPNSISIALHLIRASGKRLCSGRKFWHVGTSWLHLRTKEEIIPIIHLRQLPLSSMILKFPLSTRYTTSGTSWTSWVSRTAGSAGYTARMASSSITSRWKRRKYLVWVIIPASATFTAWASTFSNTNEWWRRWGRSATTGRETKTTIQITWASISSLTSAAGTTNSAYEYSRIWWWDIKWVFYNW